MITEREAFDALLRTNLYAYAHKAFQVIEPSSEFEDNWHIGCICEHLEAVSNGEIPKLIINLPPRLLKSVLVAQIFPTWELGRNPSTQFIGASYAHTLAERNVMKSRQIIQSEMYQHLFPKTIISSDNNQKDYFTTTQNGQYKGTGIGGTITGFGANFLLIDDPISPKEGMSPTVRASTINEIRSTLFSRYNDKRKEKFVMIMQRLHEADPTGDLLEDGGYYHLKLPAYAPDKSYSYSLHGKTWELKQGDYLSPRLDKDTLDKLRVELGQYNYVGQYLQDPVPLSGGEFNEQWIGYYQNGALSPSKMNVYILMDASGGDELKKKKKKTSDWSAYMVVGLAADNNYYLLDVVRDRLNPTERINTLFTLHRKWNAICGKPPKVGAEQYGMMTDIHYIKEKMTTDSYHFQIVQLGGSMAKEDRIRRLIPDIQNGRWFFPHSVLYVDSEGRKFDLIQELVKAEMPTFPRARYDDMLDALSRIYDDELMKVFPKLDANMVQRAYNQSNAPSTSWEDY
jgi:predicted phage terminase large subunit-like protein